MAIDACDVCGCIPAYMKDDFFYRAAINLLCQIQQNTGTGGEGFNLAEVGGDAITLGQKAMAASLPVVLASDQDFVKAEDAPVVSGDKGIPALATVNTSLTARAADGDYALIATNTIGAVYADINFSAQSSGGGNNALLKLEDSAVSDQCAGVAILAKRLDVLASQTTTDGDYTLPTADSFGRQYVDTVLRSSGTAANASVASASSVTLVAANAQRKYLRIQNNSAANIVISLTGATLTGIVPSSTNVGFVLLPTEVYESTAAWCPVSAITVYQTSGGPIETISVISA